MNASHKLRSTSGNVRGEPPVPPIRGRGIIKCGERPVGVLRRSGASPRPAEQHLYVRFLANTLHNSGANRMAAPADPSRSHCLPISTRDYKSSNRPSRIIAMTSGAWFMDTGSDSFQSICSLPVPFPDPVLRILPGTVRARQAHGTQTRARRWRSHLPRPCAMPDWA